MPDTPTYDDLSALCAQMAAALEAWQPYTGYVPESVYSKHHEALRAYRTLSPDPVWQMVPEDGK